MPCTGGAEKFLLCTLSLPLLYWSWLVWVSTSVAIIMCPHIPIFILLYIVGRTRCKNRKTMEHSNAHRLQCCNESGKVSTLPWHSVQVHITQTLLLFLQSYPCVLAEDFLSWQDIPTLTYTGLGVAWSGLLIFDSAVFGMMLYKSIILSCPNGVNILDILLHDGGFYLSGNSFLLWT